MSEVIDIRRGYDEPCWVCGSNRNYANEHTDPLNVAISELVKKFKEMKCPVEVELYIKDVVDIRWEKKSVYGRDPKWTITLNDKFYWLAPLQHRLALVASIKELAEAIIRAKEKFIPKLDNALVALKFYLDS